MPQAKKRTKAFRASQTYAQSAVYTYCASPPHETQGNRQRRQESGVKMKWGHTREAENGNGKWTRRKKAEEGGRKRKKGGRGKGEVEYNVMSYDIGDAWEKPEDDDYKIFIKLFTEYS